MIEYDKIRRVFISAQTGSGLDLLRQAIGERANERAVALEDASHIASDDVNA